MGSGTYHHAVELGWAYGDTPVIVLTSRKLQAHKSSVEFYSGDLKSLDDHLKAKYRNVWLVGGAKVTKEFLRLNLADEIVLSILPILLGEGKLFFDCIGTEHKLHLKDSVAFNDGMVELTYAILKN